MTNSTKSSPIIAVGIIVILLIIAGAVYFFTASKATAPTTATSTPVAAINSNVVNYSCDSGSIVATYTNSASSTPDGSVALMLSDGRTLTLPQVMSGSGIRYELSSGAASAKENNVQFSSEGDNAFLEENGKTTYDNCVAGNFSVSADGSKSFTDLSKTFSFSYPSAFQISGGGIGYTQSWMVNATTTGMLLVKAVLPSSFEPKTNFANATFTVGTSADPDAVAQCLINSDGGNGVQKSTVTVNGVTYTKLVTSDAGAGNFYQTTSYRVVRNNQCYAIEYTIHSSNIGNYSPDQGIKAFNQTTVQNALDGIVSSFKFLP